MNAGSRPLGAVCPLLSVALTFLILAIVPAPARAGVVNPDISVIGQPMVRATDNPNDPDPNRVRLDSGETEIVFDAYLNPYAKGYFTTSLGSDGLQLEEGYFTLLRGLPAGLVLKGGKYRVGFGKLNSTHPHAVPFADAPDVLRTYLPGEEGLNETGISLSGRIPMPGTISLTASVDWLQGDSFRIPRTASGARNDPLEIPDGKGDLAGETRPAVLGRLSGFAMVGERSGLELGLSALEGTSNVAAQARTVVLGADAKAKLWTGENSYVLLQGELLKLERDDAGWDSVTAAYAVTRVSPVGGYAFVDWNISPRHDAGLLYERHQQPTPDKPWDQSYGAFVGLSLMEETTAFRLDWRRTVPGSPEGAPSPASYNTVTMRVIYSMGPHKAHQF
jgi:hypothetical protein